MTFDKFFTPTITVSPYQLAKLSPRVYIQKIKRVVFTRGSYEFSYSEELEGELHTANLFSQKYASLIKKADFNLIDHLKYAKSAQGIDGQQKEAILKNLVPLMPPEKASYWQNLPLSKGPKSDF